MDPFTIELVSKASAQLFLDNTLSYFTNFLPEQLNLEGQWEVAISEISYGSMYQNVTEGEFMFFDKKLSKSLEFYYLEPGLYHSIADIVEATNTLIQERHNHSQNFNTVKVSGTTQKIEFYLANEGSGLAFFRTNMGHIFGSNVGNEFGVMLRENDLTNQNLLTTLSAYTHSWYTRIWLNTISLVTRRLHCCVAFFSFRSSRLETF